MAVGRLAEKILVEMGFGRRAPVDRRGPLEAQTGTILYVDPNVFRGILSNLFPNTLTSGQIEEIWKLWDSWLSKRTANLSVARMKELTQERKMHWAAGTIPRGEGYIITSFEVIKRGKNASGYLGKIIKEKLKDSESQENIDALDRLGGSDLSKPIDQGGRGLELAGAQTGHQEGNRGVATSSLKILNAERQIGKSRSKAVQAETRFQDAVLRYRNAVGLKITHEQILTKDGKLRKSYVPVLTYQSAVDNQQLQQDELNAYNAFGKEMEELATMPGSTPLNDALTQVLLGKVVAPKKKRKNTRVVGERKNEIKEKHSAAKTKTRKLKKKARVIKDSGIDNKSISSLAKQKDRAKRVSPFAYVAMINKKLPQTIRKNMREPALVNRSGRFASSVKVQTADMTKQGYPSFGYDYQKDPYQVFEVGQGTVPWSTSQRDPRKLIDKSIREVAAELALGRFYTRRL
tara:strand:+ start:629 stop:2011 length:1383 start_codon:yes stop_codon:yes gene_type:complete